MYNITDVCLWQKFRFEVITCGLGNISESLFHILLLPTDTILPHRHFNFCNVCLTGLKRTLFNKCLVQDTWMIGAGGTFVLVCMWLYTGSLFVTIMTVIAIVFSLGISYFMYTLVFELNFFPFMNLLATVVAIGK